MLFSTRHDCVRGCAAAAAVVIIAAAEAAARAAAATVFTAVAAAATAALTVKGLSHDVVETILTALTTAAPSLATARLQRHLALWHWPPPRAAWLRNRRRLPTPGRGILDSHSVQNRWRLPAPGRGILDLNTGVV